MLWLYLKPFHYPFEINFTLFQTFSLFPLWSFLQINSNIFCNLPFTAMQSLVVKGIPRNGLVFERVCSSTVPDLCAWWKNTNQKILLHLGLKGVSIYSSLYNLSENKIKLPYKVINGFCILDCIVKPVIHNTIQYGINLLDASNKGLHHFNTCQLWYNKGNYLEMLLDILSQYWKRDNLI